MDTRSSTRRCCVIELSKKSLPDIINTKAYYVAAGAQKFTKKAELSDLKAFARIGTNHTGPSSRLMGLKRGSSTKRNDEKFYNF